MYNRIILLGRLTAKPQLSTAQSGKSYTRFSIAADRQFANKETGAREADFISCTAFGKTAEFICKYFLKGSPILVEGSLQNNNYTDKNGAKQYSYVVMVNSVNFAGSTGGNQAQVTTNYTSQPQNASQGNYKPDNSVSSVPEELGSLDGFEDLATDADMPF